MPEQRLTLTPASSSPPDSRPRSQTRAHALAEREAAYRANDLVAAAEADQRLTDALARALVLSDQ